MLWGLIFGIAGETDITSFFIEKDNDNVEEIIFNSQQAIIDLEMAKLQVWIDFLKLNPGVNYHPEIIENKQELINTLLSLKNMDKLDESTVNELFNIMNTKYAKYNFSLN